MVEHIGIMLSKNDKWIDVFYDNFTGEIYLSENGDSRDVIIAYAVSKMEVIFFLKEKYESNVEID